MATTEAQERPNIVVILADDLGVGDVSKYRRMHTDKIIMETPNIDALAEDGMIFTNGYSPSALSATSRYGIMTGSCNYRSPKPWGVWGGYEKGVFTDETLTLGRLMKRADYNTAFIGKWHMGTQFRERSNPNKIYNARENRNIVDVDITKIVGDGPSQNGFDYNFTLPSGIQSVPYAMYENDEWYPMDKRSMIGVIDTAYSVRMNFHLEKKVGLGDSMWDPSRVGPMIAHKAVDYIRTQSEAVNPFFLYYCSQAVHTPHCAPDSLDGVKIKGATKSNHMDMITELDVQVKMITDELKRQGVYDNTIIIFTSDNGGLHVDGNTWYYGHEPSDIYRGFKNTPYEGGSRVPYIVTWGDRVARGSQSSEYALGQDIMATLAAVAGVEIEDGDAPDSYNLLPVLMQEKKIVRRPYLMQQAGGEQREVMINEGGWKLIIHVDPKDKTNNTRTPIALFNLNNNPTEEESGNMIDNPKYRSKVKHLFEKYNEVRDGGEITVPR